MASLATHLAAFLFVVPTGLTRLVRSSSHFLTNPSLFKSKPFYILSSDQPTWKNLDFYALTISLPIAILSEAFLFSTTADKNPTLRFSMAHQSIVLCLFWALVVLTLLRESVDFFRAVFNEGLIFFFAGISFVSEYWVSGKGIGGVFSDVYGLLGFLALLCGFCCFYLAINPSSFFADFLLSSGLVFKGTWVLQIGLSLYTDTFGLKGCGNNGKVVNFDVKCDLDEDGFRAVALMRLLFLLHSVLVLVLGFVLIGFLAKKRSGSSLSQLDLENLMMRNSSELEIE